MQVPQSSRSQTSIGFVQLWLSPAAESVETSFTDTRSHFDLLCLCFCAGRGWRLALRCVKSLTACLVLRSTLSFYSIRQKTTWKVESRILPTRRAAAASSRRHWLRLSSAQSLEENHGEGDGEGEN